VVDQGGDPLGLADRDGRGRDAQPQFGVELDDEEHHQDDFGTHASKWLTAESLRDDDVDGEEVDAGDERPRGPMALEFSGGKRETGGADDEERDRTLHAATANVCETGCAVPGQWAKTLTRMLIPAKSPAMP